MTVDPHQTFMRLALRLARRGQGRVEPNPMVGCVIVRNGTILGRGFHARFGGPHAEVAALADCQQRGHDPRGAEVLVTLEPCCHHGKTPPCTGALLNAGVKRVFVAMRDPFPQVAGGGIAALEAAGVEVRVGLCEEEAAWLNEPFVKRVTTGRPWTIAKWAQTLDGRIATRDGQSKWISNDRSRKVVHQIRARVDAVMVGIGTALADDPLLTARGIKRTAIARVARRVVVDPDARLSLSSQLIATLDQAPLTLAVRQSRVTGDAATRLRDRGVEILALPDDPADPGHLSLAPLLEHLAKQHAATNVLVEGGATLTGTLLRQQLVDEVVVFVAPTLAGDPLAIGAVLIGPLREMKQARRLILRNIRRLGDDVMLTYRVAPPGPP